MLGILIGLTLLATLALVPFIALARASRALRAVDDLRRELEGRLKPAPTTATDAAVPEGRSEPAPTTTTDAAVPEGRSEPAPATTTDAAVPEGRSEPAPTTTTAAAVPEGRSEPAPTTTTAAAVPEGRSEPAPTAETTTTTAAESLEARIGGRWLLYVGVGAIVVAAAYFVKLAIDSQWVTETMRVAIGAVAGLAMVWAGGRFARGGFPLYGQMLAGGGIAVLYLSIYAAFNFYALAGRAPAFGLMVAVTGLAAWLADGQRSQGLALMAVGGGFFTPFLVGGETDAQTALFGYDAILVAGTAYLSRRRDWPALNLASYGLTLVTIAGWLAAFYMPASYLRTVLFLTVFCALFGYILVHAWRSASLAAPIVRIVLGTAPPLYYVTSVALLFPHSLALLIFFVACTAVGLALARRAGAAWPRLALWIAVAVPLLSWADTRADASWLAAGVTVAAALFALHLAAQIDAARGRGDAPRAADVLLYHLNGLGLFAVCYLLLEDGSAAWQGAAAASVAAIHFGIAALARRLHREPPLHYAAAGAALAAMAIAIWSDGAWTVVGLAIESSALVAIGLIAKREWLRLTGGALLGLTVLWLVGLEFQPVGIDYTPLANARTIAAVVLAALLAGLARFHRYEAGEEMVERALQDSDYFTLASNLVLLVTVTTEINAFWEFRGGGRPSALSRQAALTVAWTLQAIGVIRVGLSRGSRVLQTTGLVLMFAPFAWLSATLWTDVVDRVVPPVGYVVLVNARAAAAIVVAGCLLGLVRMVGRARPSPGGGRVIAGAALGASLLALGWLSAESSAFWHLRDAGGGDPRLVFHFARELTLSVLWASYAAALVAAGIQRRFAPIRHFAIGLFLVTVAKVGLVDLAELERLYRVLSIMALGVLLLVASYLYQRFSDRLAGAPEL